jgi:hypothetical protein
MAWTLIGLPAIESLYSTPVAFRGSLFVPWFFPLLMAFFFLILRLIS